MGERSKMENQILADIAEKCAEDVSAAIKRTLSIAPEPKLPVAIMAGAAALGWISALLAERAGTYDPTQSPDPDTLLLAGLLAARLGMDGDSGIADAYEDLRILKEAGRLESRP